MSLINVLSVTFVYLKVIYRIIHLIFKAFAR